MIFQLAENTTNKDIYDNCLERTNGVPSMYFEMFTFEYVVSGFRFGGLGVVSRYFHSDNADHNLQTKWACQYSTHLNRSLMIL